jgi:sugar O-acyltransferase (sialic acid O-acetyltransferase NeuD family)
MAHVSLKHSAATSPPGGVAVLGAGSLGQQIAQYLIQNETGTLMGFFDDTQPVGTVTAHGPVLGPVASIAAAFAERQFGALLMGIGYGHMAARQRLFEELSGQGIPFATWVHPAAVLDSSVRLGPGCIVLAGCVLDLNVIVGANVFLYPGCIVAHDTQLASHSFLAPGVRLAGHVRVAERCFLGIGTTVIDYLTVGPDVRTGGGAVVTRDLLVPGTYAGVPARHLRDGMNQ